MAIALQSQGTVVENSVAGTSLLVPYPATLDASSMMVLMVAVQSASLPTLPGGWTQVYRASGTGGTLAPGLMVAIKQATGSETGNLTVTTPSLKSIGQLLAFSGVDLSTPQDVTASPMDQSSALGTLPIPGVTTTLTGAALIYAGATNSSTTNATAPTSPSTFTETADRGSSTVCGTLGYLLWGSFGATGTVTVTWTGSPKSVGVLLALRPAIAVASGAVAMTETAALTVAGTVTSATSVAMTETAALTVAGTRGQPAAVAMTATSAMTVAASLPYDLHTYEEGSNGAAVPNSANGVIALVGAPTYTTAAAVHGALGVHGGTANAMLGYANPTPAGSAGSVYGKVNTLPTTGSRNAFVKFTDSSNVTLGSISINLTSGTFCIVIGGTVYATSTVAVAAGDVFRLDWQEAWDGTNLAVTARLFLRTNFEGRTRDQEITATHTSGSSPARTFVGVSVSTTWDVTFDTLRLYPTLVWPAPYNPAITPGTVVRTWTGDPLADGFVLVSKVLDGTSLRLAVSTSMAMTSPTYFAAQVPDADGYATHIATGLTAATTYFYQLLDTPIGGVETLIGTPGRTKTTPAVGTPVGFTVAMMSCQVNNSIVSNALDDLVTWDPTFACHVGDLHYRAISSILPADHAAGLETQIANAAGLKNALANLPIIYANSDGEAGPNNGDSNTAWNAAFNTAYRQAVPSRMVDTLPSPVGKYRTWVVGRIRFILIDSRSTDRSPGAAVDDSAKTFLGATQKTWLKAQLLQSEPVKVIICDNGWMGTATGFQWQDKWQSYNTERTEIGAFIVANHVQVDYWHGDSHYLGVDATHNAWGGFPVLCCSPLDQVGSSTDVTFFDSAYSSTLFTASYSQYMRITFADDGVTITRTASGWDALNNVERVSQVKTWSSTAVGVVAMTETSSMTVAGKKTQLGAVAMTSTHTLTAETSDPTTIATIRLRRNTRAGAIASNPILLNGEPGFDGDAIRVGSTAGDHWVALPQTMMEGAGTLVVKTGNYALAITDRVVIGNGTSITLTMLAASTTAIPGRHYTLKNINATALTVASAGGNIDGGSTISLAQWAKAELVSDGTNWLTI